MKAVKESNEIPRWRKDILDKMQAKRQARFDEEKAHYNQRLTDLIDIYFRSYTLDEEEVKNNYDILNGEWKTLCAKTNTLRKGLISLRPEAFEKAIEENLAHPEFQKGLEQMKADLEKQELEAQATDEPTAEIQA